MKFRIKEYSRTILLYIAVFLISIICHASVLFLHSANYGFLFFEEQISVLFILLLSFSSVTMLFCLRHFHGISEPSVYGVFIFSVSYSLCSYTFIQSKSWQNILVFVLLPVLYYTLEQMILYNKTLLFLIAAAVCLALDSLTTAAIMLCLLFVVIFYLHSSEYKVFTSVLHYILICLLSVLLSGILSFPQIGTYFTELKGRAYSGFHVSLSLPVFFSRFCPGAISSTVYAGVRGINVYFGLFALLCCIAFFFSSGIDKKRKLPALVLTGIFLAFMQLSPLQFVAELFKESNSLYIYYDFFFVFFFLIIGFEGYERAGSHFIKEILPPILVFALFILITMLGASHNIHPMSQTTIIAFAIVYGLCFVLKGIASDRIKALILICTVLELTLSAVSVSFQDFIPESMASAQSESGEAVSDETEQIYEDFCAKHIDKELYYDLESIEQIADNAFGYTLDPLFSGSYFDRYNTICRGIGFENDLFEEVKSASVTFQEEYGCSILYEGHQIYYVYNPTSESMPLNKVVSYHMNGVPEDFYVAFDLYDTPFHFTQDDEESQYEGYISLPIPEKYGANVRVSVYTINPKVYGQVKKSIELFSSFASTNFVPMPVYYAAIAATCIGIFIILFFTINSEKKKYIDKMTALKKKLDESRRLNIVRDFVRDNRIYFLSVLIPACILLVCVVIFDMQPFGKNTIWESDGMLSVLPFAINNVRSLKAGNWYLSYNGSYGYSILPTQPLYHLFAYIVPQSILIVFFQYVVFSLITLSSFTMIYYLTHRLSKPAADKQDLKLLIPGLIYSLNSFMLYMRGYMNWYYIIVLLPLIIYALERLMYKKKWTMYVVLLSFCMFVDIPTAYFVCLLLVLVFLFYEHFDSVRDFFIKGIRFGICSILAALNTYCVIRGMFSAKTSGSTGYAEADSVSPTFKFFGSYFNQWKQHMIFSSSDVITEDSNSIILYASVLCVLLLFLYLLNKNIKIKEKVRRLIPVILLYFTFNENISSYIISGFHYQSNVPNRHVFILLFLLCILIYDGISASLPTAEMILAAASAVLVFICLCQFLSDGNDMTAFWVSVILIVIYGLVLYANQKKKVSLPYHHILLFLLIGELSANAVFIFSGMRMDAINSLGDYNMVENYIEKNLDTEGDIYRTCLAADQLINVGLIYGMPTIDYFVPNLSNNVIRFNKLLGGVNGSNYVQSQHANSLITNTMFGIKYIVIPKYATTSVANLNSYSYLGSFDRYYFFENQDVFAPAYYAPGTIVDAMEEETYTPYEIIDTIRQYLPDSDDIFDITYLSNVRSETVDYDAENNYAYISDNGDALLTTEALSFLKTLPDSAIINDLFRMSIHITPEHDGVTYLFIKEYIPLGYLKAGHTYHFELNGPKSVENDYHACFTLNEETYHQFLEYMQDKQLTDLHYDKFSITGTSHYPEDGYTLFSFPYSASWEAFIDGKKTELISPHDTYMLVKTPAGEHEVRITLSRRIYNRNVMITLAAWVVTLLAFMIGVVLNKKRSHKQNVI